MKVRLILPVLLLCLLLTACGSREEAESAAPAAEDPAAAALLPEPELPSLSLEESQAMARVRNANRILWEGTKLYCYDFDEDWNPVLARYRWRDGELGDFTVLARGCIPEYLCRTGGWLYYIDRGSGDLERVPDRGGEREQLHVGPCSSLTLRDGTLYFCDRRGRFLSRSAESGREEELLEGPCAFAYPLEGAILWQGADGQGLFLTDPDTGATRTLFEGSASAPLLLEDRLWYISGGRLCSLSAEGISPSRMLPETDSAVELLPEPDGLRLRGIRDENGPRQWEGGYKGPFHRYTKGWRICDWLKGSVWIDTVYEPDGRIRCYLLHTEEGRELSFLAGRIKD